MPELPKRASDRGIEHTVGAHMHRVCFRDQPDIPECV